jgi:hypothetical protein
LRFFEELEHEFGEGSATSAGLFIECERVSKGRLVAQKTMAVMK